MAAGWAKLDRCGDGKPKIGSLGGRQNPRPITSLIAASAGQPPCQPPVIGIAVCGVSIDHSLPP
jgi:hypothetical protein